MARRLIKLARGPIVHDSIMMHLYSKNKQVYLHVHVLNKVTSVWVLLHYCINLSITKMNCFNYVPTK